MRAIRYGLPLLVCCISLFFISAAQAIPTPRIVGGKIATSAPPGMATLNITIGNSQYLCGASVLSTHWVLTAGHCVVDEAGRVLPARNIGVSAGALNMSELNNLGYERADVVRLYDGWYQTRDGSPIGDIALVHLPNGFEGDLAHIDRTDNIQYLKAGTALSVSGWGTTSSGAPSSSEQLRTAQVGLLSASKCSRYFGSDWSSGKMLCVGGYYGPDSCQGDSGGPLSVKTDEGLSLVGVTSYGDGCGGSRGAVYARLGDTLTSWVDSYVPDITITTPSTIHTNDTVPFGFTPTAAANVAGITWSVDGSPITDNGDMTASWQAVHGTHTVSAAVTFDDGSEVTRSKKIIVDPKPVRLAWSAYQVPKGSTLKTAVVFSSDAAPASHYGYALYTKGGHAIRTGKVRSSGGITVTLPKKTGTYYLDVGDISVAKPVSMTESTIRVIGR